MIHIICGACRNVIGMLDSKENLQSHGDAIAEAHQKSCRATDEEHEQAVYDMKFRQMTQGLWL